MGKKTEITDADRSGPAAGHGNNGSPPPAAGPLLEPTPQLAARVREAIGADGLSQARAAREIGISDSALSQWLAGAYAGDAAAVDAKVGPLARGASAERCIGPRPSGRAGVGGHAFRPGTALAGLSYAQMAGCIGVVHGAAGTGKTRACRRYAADSPNVWIATMSPWTQTVHACLEQVALACGLRTVEFRSARIAAALVGRLRDTRGLLAVDEAQHLGTRALEGLRSLYDATGTGLALIGSDELYSRLTGGSRSDQFAQLFSRIGKRVRLPAATAADADALLAAWGIESGEARKAARLIARQPGGLRGLRPSTQARLGSCTGRDGDGGAHPRRLEGLGRHGMSGKTAEIPVVAADAAEGVPRAGGHV